MRLITLAEARPRSSRRKAHCVFRDPFGKTKEYNTWITSGSAEKACWEALAKAKGETVDHMKLAWKLERFVED